MCSNYEKQLQGIQIQEAYSLIVMGLMFVIAVYYEVRIIQILRDMRK